MLAAVALFKIYKNEFPILDIGVYRCKHVHVNNSNSALCDMLQLEMCDMFTKLKT